MGQEERKYGISWNRQLKTLKDPVPSKTARECYRDECKSSRERNEELAHMKGPIASAKTSRLFRQLITTSFQ